ncbi:MAG: Unknown protein [uncultured Sulfurovum sp.]|uniref:Glycosyltransferase 2-like domain-containing protein n=1 Tax=uncultured Sulfurovum sp. TaxID=269237 RepID=A0A6S6U803_9BACT|nr:MAG: Unknown protein [uncultured Sulfurovum sp.]
MNKKKKIVEVAVVTLFNPNEDVYFNIKSYLPYVKELLIVDNSEELSPLIFDLQKEFSSVVLLSSLNNIGIAKALNLALLYAEENNYSWLLTMDQDTSFSDTKVQTFIDYFYNRVDDDLAIFSPLHNKKFLVEYEFINKQKEFVMTSANIINVKKSIDSGMFDEKLFIDEVDHDFCLSLKENRYDIIQNYNIYVHHTLGEKHKCVNVNLYRPQRLYYMLRNYLYIRDKHKDNNLIFFKTRDKYLFKFFLKQFIYNKNKIEILKMVGQAITDYKNNSMGYTIKL